MSIRAINNNILFIFNDAVNSRGDFVKGATESGIILKASRDDSAKSPRWATVTHVGPDSKGIQVGQQILLPALRWTLGGKFEETKFWKTDCTEVVAVRDNKNSNIRPLNDFIIFQPIVASKTTSSGLFIPVADTNTPQGKVLLLGDDCMPELKQSIIFYNGANFTDTFDHDGVELAFIKQPSILAYTSNE